MMSVYRIYFGRSWLAGGETAGLLGLFDSLPDFLYTSHELPDDIAMTAAGTSDAAVKVAMAQCHVVLIRVGEPNGAEDWSKREIEIARSAFRRRIPVLAVVPPGGDQSHPLARLADRTVEWSGVEIARAVQELASAAAVKRRQQFERPASSQAARSAHVAQALDLGADGNRQRHLPMTEIVAAYNRLKASRAGGSV